jgi:periplasmic copper chaperone A
LSGEKDAIFWKVRPEGGLEIKPGETVTLKPGSDHLMLMKLKHPLEAGKTVEATLQFDARMGSPSPYSSQTSTLTS